MEVTTDEDVLVLADADLAVDLLRNIIVNAINAEPMDDTVYLSWNQTGNQVTVVVEDHGKGISADELSRILEPFYMVDKSRSRREGGSGLGLSLCQRICELHGGTLNIQSELGHGTEVSFMLLGK